MQPSEVEKFKEMYEGTVIALNEESTYPLTMRGIRHDGETQHTTFFDLHGRQLQGKPARGMYIRDGKKYAVGR